jgi:hypothetical protein
VLLTAIFSLCGTSFCLGCECSVLDTSNLIRHGCHNREMMYLKKQKINDLFPVYLKKDANNI